MLKKLTIKYSKPLYHFRFQTDDGYIDIIFSDFIIRKKAGRVKYPIKETAFQTFKPLTKEEKKTALESDDDFERFFAMTKLFKNNDPDLLEIARRLLWLGEENEDSCFYSAYLLGKLGDSSDITKLWSLYLNIEEFINSKSLCRSNPLLLKRNILDSIELIHFRNP